MYNLQYLANTLHNIIYQVMQSIKSIETFISGDNTAFVDEVGHIYICGSNILQKVTNSPSRVIEQAVKIDFQLAEGEKIIAFKSYLANICIWTNQKRLVLLSSKIDKPYGIGTMIVDSPKLEKVHVDTDPDDETYPSISVKDLLSRPFVPFEERSSIVLPTPVGVSNTRTSSRHRVPSRRNIAIGGNNIIATNIRNIINESIGGNDRVVVQMPRIQPDGEISIGNDTLRAMVEQGNMAIQEMLLNSLAPIRAWRPLTREEFLALEPTQMAAYVEDAQRRISVDYSRETWATDDVINELIMQITEYPAFVASLQTTTTQSQTSQSQTSQSETTTTTTTITTTTTTSPTESETNTTSVSEGSGVPPPLEQMSMITDSLMDFRVRDEMSGFERGGYFVETLDMNEINMTSDSETGSENGSETDIEPYLVNVENSAETNEVAILSSESSSPRSGGSNSPMSQTSSPPTNPATPRSRTINSSPEMLSPSNTPTTTMTMTTPELYRMLTSSSPTTNTTETSNLTLPSPPPINDTKSEIPARTSCRKFESTHTIIDNVLNVVFGTDCLLYWIGAEAQRPSSQDGVGAEAQRPSSQDGVCAEAQLPVSQKRMKDSFVVEQFTQAKINDASKSDNYARLATRPYGEQKNCRELCINFSIDELHFTEYFMYIKSGKWHNVIIPQAADDSVAHWIQFESKFELRVDQIHWCAPEETIYIMHETGIYKYLRQEQQLRSIPMLPKLDYRFMKYLSGELFYISRANVNNGLDLFFGARSDCYKSIASQGHAMLEIHYLPRAFWKLGTISVNSSDDTILAVFDFGTDVTQNGIISSTDHTIIINVRGLKCWGSRPGAFFAFIVDEYLHVIVNNLIHWDAGTPLDITRHTTYAHIIYALPVPSNMILKATIADSIMIETATDIYCAYLISNFEFVKANKHVIVNNKSLQLINYTAFSGSRNALISNEIALHMQIDEKYLPELLSITKMFQTDTLLHIDQYRYKEKIAHGNGVATNFIHQALAEFESEYLIKHNQVTELRLERLKQCTDIQLFIIGKMFALCINNLSSQLSIRLPLIVIAAIRRLLPSKRALEFFAALEDPEAFAMLKGMENSPTDLEAYGFSYEEGLRNACKFDCWPHADRKIAYGIARKIADGFLHHSALTEFAKINLPTMDAYISGPYKIDVNKFISKIHFSSNATPFKEKFIHLVKLMRESQLRTLLINWSGTSVIKTRESGMNYIVDVATSNNGQIVFYKTCTLEITIDPKLFSEFTETEAVDILCDTCTLLKG